MDILRPPLEQQVSPAPWLVARSNVDVPALIGRVLTQQPDATVDNIVTQLSDWGVQVSGIIVTMWVLKYESKQPRQESPQLSHQPRSSNGEKPSPIAPRIPSFVLAASRNRLGGSNTAAVLG